MSGIESVQGQYGQGSWGVSSVSSGRTSRVGPPSGDPGMPDEMEQALESALDASGMDEKTQENLMADLEAALSSLFSSSNNGTMPAPEDVKETIDGVLEKYGMDGEKIFGQMRPSGPPPGAGGPPPTGAEGGTSSTEETDDTSELTLLESLLAQLKSVAEGDETDTTLTAREFAQRILDVQFGFGAEA